MDAKQTPAATTAAAKRVVKETLKAAGIDTRLARIGGAPTYVVVVIEDEDAFTAAAALFPAAKVNSYANHPGGEVIIAR